MTLEQHAEWLGIRKKTKAYYTLIRLNTYLALVSINIRYKTCLANFKTSTFTRLYRKCYRIKLEPDENFLLRVKLYSSMWKKYLHNFPWFGVPKRFQQRVCAMHVVKWICFIKMKNLTREKSSSHLSLRHEW